jgi:hypothetical protein
MRSCRLKKEEYSKCRLNTKRYNIDRWTLKRKKIVTFYPIPPGK